MEGVAQDGHHTHKHSTWSSHKKKEEAASKGWWQMMIQYCITERTQLGIQIHTNLDKYCNSEYEQD